MGGTQAYRAWRMNESFTSRRLPLKRPRKKGGQPDAHLPRSRHSPDERRSQRLRGPSPSLLPPAQLRDGIFFGVIVVVGGGGGGGPRRGGRRCDPGHPEHPRQRRWGLGLGGLGRRGFGRRDGGGGGRHGGREGGEEAGVQEGEGPERTGGGRGGRPGPQAGMGQGVGPGLSPIATATATASVEGGEDGLHGGGEGPEVVAAGGVRGRDVEASTGGQEAVAVVPGLRGRGARGGGGRGPWERQRQPGA